MRRRIPGLALGPVVASLLIWQTSTAAFQASTDNGPSTFAAGTVTLTDDDSSAVLFSMSNLVPLDTQTKCIKVSYTGSSFDLTPVKLYAALPTNVDAFAAELDVTIEQGTGGTFANCTGFTSASTLFTGTLASLASTKTDFASGLTGFTPASGSVDRTYRFTVTLGSDTPNTAQGDSASATLTWEIQSA